jgi:hypothetical protein
MAYVGRRRQPHGAVIPASESGIVHEARRQRFDREDRLRAQGHNRIELLVGEALGIVLGAS